MKQVQALLPAGRHPTAPGSRSQDLKDKEALVLQVLDLAQQMAFAYQQAPGHIRRLLNQPLTAVYITPIRPERPAPQHALLPATL